MKPLGAVVTLCLLAPAGCVHERLDWRFPDGSYDPERLAEDIDACEEYTAIADDDRRFVTGRGARAYGGWGSFAFEYCMNKKGWTLTRVPTDRGRRG